MIAILLCAGYATRMYPLTRDFPKPLLPVAGKPVLDYLMEQLMALQDLDGVHIVTNDRFALHFDRWQKTWNAATSKNGVHLVVHNDGSTDNENRLGASKDLSWVLGRIPNTERMLVSAGDNIFRFRLGPLWARFLAGDVHNILALPEADQKKLQRTGVIEFGKNDRAVRLYEKPKDPPSRWSCPAIYFLQPSAVSLLNGFLEFSENLDAPGHFVDFLCQNSHVKAIRLDAARLDIGSDESYREADRILRQEPAVPE